MFQRSYRHLPLQVTPAWFLLACSSESPGAGSSDTGAVETNEAEDHTPTDPTSSGAEPSTTADGSTGTTSSSTSTSSTGPAVMCGDGILDEDEQCDDGADNRDDGACTLDCKTAVCGDGLVWAGVEVCDEAADNGTLYGGCSPTCTNNQRCGDGVLDIGYEDCDYGENNGSGEADGDQGPCSNGCTWDARIVFLTSLLYGGDLIQQYIDDQHPDEDPGGLEAADGLCQERAWAAGMQRWQTFRAWLSDHKLGPLDRFVIIPARPLVLPNGELIADSLSDLVLNGPGDGIRVDEFGAPLPPSLVWTNTGITGEPGSEVDHCDDWSDTKPGLSTLVGLSHQPHEPEEDWKKWQTGKQWTNKLMWACYEQARLYCFEQ